MKVAFGLDEKVRTQTVAREILKYEYNIVGKGGHAR